MNRIEKEKQKKNTNKYRSFNYQPLNSAKDRQLQQIKHRTEVYE